MTAVPSSLVVLVADVYLIVEHADRARAMSEDGKSRR